MDKQFQRVNKYLVIKQTDADKYLSYTQKRELGLILAAIYMGRTQDGERPNSYVVVNQDQPYAEKVWQLIQEQWEKDNLQNTAKS